MFLPMNWLQNISLNLRASGPAAILMSWIIGVAALGLFGNGELAENAMITLQVGGGMMIIVLAQKV
jgi:hypothetical protein